MTSKKAPPEPSTPDDTDATMAFTTVQPIALALPKDKVTSPNTGVDAAIIAALAVAREANAAPLRARFESLPKKELDQPFQGHFPLNFDNNCAVDTWELSTC